jgi:hypothetical protein
LVDRLEELVPVTAHDPVVGLIGGDRFLSARPELKAGALLPVVRETADVDELRGEIPSVASHESERASGFYSGKLGGITNKKYLGSGAAGGSDEFIEGQGSGQGRLVDDQKLARLESAQVDLGVEV